MFWYGKALMLLVLAILIVVFSVNPQEAPVKETLTLQSVLATLAGIFVIVLLVERATEIVVSIWRGSRTQELEAELGALTGAKAADAPAKAQEVARYKAETKERALLTGFVISVVVCAAGVGLLGTIVTANPTSKPFLRGVDIVLTSGLIAGGSDAFHQFVRALETFFTQMKAQLEQKKP
jgi:hypothetical protein